MSDTNPNLLVRAVTFAENAHAGQRYGPHAYIAHAVATVAVLRRFDIIDEEILAAGYLHDVLEDCPQVTSAILFQHFPPETVDIVLCVTDGPGADRLDKKYWMYKKVRAHHNHGAVTVKLADRIANTEYSRIHCQRKFEMYNREHLQFRSELAYGNHQPQPLHVRAMWEHLYLITTSPTGIVY